MRQPLLGVKLRSASSLLYVQPHRHLLHAGSPVRPEDDGHCALRELRTGDVGLLPLQGRRPEARLRLAVMNLEWALQQREQSSTPS